MSKDQFKNNHTGAADASRIGADDHPFSHRLGAGGNEKLLSFDLNNADTAVGFHILIGMEAKGGNFNIQLFRGLKNGSTFGHADG